MPPADKGWSATEPVSSPPKTTARATSPISAPPAATPSMPPPGTGWTPTAPVSSPPTHPGPATSTPPKTGSAGWTPTGNPAPGWGPPETPASGWTTPTPTPVSDLDARNAADPTVALGVVETPRERPARPPAVVAAMVLVNLVGVGLFALSLLFATLGPAVFFVPLVGATIMGWLGRGIWRGSRLAFGITSGLSALVIVSGVASIGGGSIGLTLGQLVVPAVLIGLLTAQPATRTYFWHR
ncbi:hypothetical protein [Cryptosporangium phraense]|uniref:Uncharacterized protein n=1 Tax=Cryptosporangium phraense TaxID=2593070 RepID=A0A545AHX3_9ACTN|nr:hypothetical protein [Cryptosporangium phraense]TQS40908.1 hypothetical protein FL583_32295 [Cryptosporangium phraense]